MPAKLSRKCIPYTPFRKELREATLAIVSMAGVHLTSQPPFDLESDTSYRVIPGGAATTDLMVTHEHYDHQDASRDPNIMFPLDRARELAADGFIAGVNNKHYSLGYAQDLRAIYDQVAPEIADALYQSQTDIVLLTAG
ncbi:MAG TPA: glycine/sarcosine/betaine reductase selenoprotein B family protein [Chloroflexota bacterium]|nr:glycine/sarcosine/betaine reductase selenoprotein B family protein [Chloroflexota bacterium]